MRGEEKSVGFDRIVEFREVVPAVHSDVKVLLETHAAYRVRPE